MSLPPLMALTASPSDRSLASLFLRAERWLEELDAALDHAHLRCRQKQESVD